MDQRRLHLQAEVCFSSPLVPCSLPFLFLMGSLSLCGRAGPNPQRATPVLPHSSTWLDLLRYCHAGQDFFGNGGMSRTTAEDRSGRLKSRRERPSLMFQDDGTLSNQLLPPIPDSTSQNKSNSQHLGLSYDLLDTCGPPAIYSLWAHLASKIFESAVKQIEKSSHLRSWRLLSRRRRL